MSMTVGKKEELVRTPVRCTNDSDLFQSDRDNVSGKENDAPDQTHYSKINPHSMNSRTPLKAFKPLNTNLINHKRQERERTVGKATPPRSTVKDTVLKMFPRNVVTSTVRVAQALSRAFLELLLQTTLAINNTDPTAQNAASAARIEQLDGELKARTAKLENQLATVTAEKESVVDESLKSLKAAQTKIDGLTNALSLMESQFAKASSERDTVLLELESKTIQVALAQRKLTELSASSESIERDKNDVILKLQTLLTERDAAHTLPNELEGGRSSQMEYDPLEVKLASVVAEHAILLQTNKNGKQRMEVLASRVAHLERLNPQLEANRETRDHLLQEQLQTQTTTENKLVDELEAAMAKLKSFSNEKNELEEKLSNENRELRKELKSKETMLSQKSSTFRTLEAKCQQLNSDVRALQKLYSNLEAENQNTIQEANQTTQELSSQLIMKEQALTRSGAEACSARVIQEELEDKRKRSLDRAVQLESRVADLKNENKQRARRNVDSIDTEKK